MLSVVGRKCDAIGGNRSFHRFARRPHNPWAPLLPSPATLPISWPVAATFCPRGELDWRCCRPPPPSRGLPFPPASFGGTSKRRWQAVEMENGWERFGTSVRVEPARINHWHTPKPSLGCGWSWKGKWRTAGSHRKGSEENGQGRPRPATTTSRGTMPKCQQPAAVESPPLNLMARGKVVSAADGTRGPRVLSPVHTPVESAENGSNGQAQLVPVVLSSPPIASKAIAVCCWTVWNIKNWLAFPFCPPPADWAMGLGAASIAAGPTIRFAPRPFRQRLFFCAAPFWPFRKGTHTAVPFRHSCSKNKAPI